MNSKSYTAFLGNCFEHYDKALFTLLIPFISPYFFPSASPLVSLLLGYAMIPISMLGRPLGALFFGYIGDRYSRSYALRLTLFGMGLSSLVVACTPPFELIGILAPILIVFMRFLIQFFSSGEVIGGALYILEKRPTLDHNMFSSFYNASTVCGYIIASAATSLFAYLDLIHSHWRLLFLFGSLTAFVGTYFRWSEKRENVFWTPSSTLKTLWENRRVLVSIGLASGFSYSTYAIAIGMMNGFIPQVSSITKEQLTYVSTAMLVLDFLLLPLFGLLSQRISTTTMMSAATLCSAVFAIPCFALLEGASLSTAIIVRTVVMIMGVCFSAPFHAWTLSLVPQKDRYTVISIGYALGTQLIGSTAAAFSLWVYHETHVVAMAGIYWMVLGAICTYILLKTKIKTHAIVGT